LAQGPGWNPHTYMPYMGYNPHASPTGSISVIENTDFSYSTTVNDKDTWINGGATQEFINPGPTMVHTLFSGALQGQVQQSYNSETGVVTHHLLIKANDVAVSEVFSDRHTFDDGQSGVLDDSSVIAYTNVRVSPPAGSGGSG
jgi:hypothetical protein